MESSNNSKPKTNSTRKTKKKKTGMTLSQAKTSNDFQKSASQSDESNQFRLQKQRENRKRRGFEKGAAGTDNNSKRRISTINEFDSALTESTERDAKASKLELEYTSKSDIGKQMV